LVRSVLLAGTPLVGAAVLLDSRSLSLYTVAISRTTQLFSGGGDA
jgi:hypothetical protein